MRTFVCSRSTDKLSVPHFFSFSFIFLSFFIIYSLSLTSPAPAPGGVLMLLEPQLYPFFSFLPSKPATLH